MHTNKYKHLKKHRAPASKANFIVYFPPHLIDILAHRRGGEQLESMMGPHRALTDITGQSNSPPQAKPAKRGVRFQDDPPEQIPSIADSVSSLQGFDKAFSDKDTAGSLYASADALLEKRPVHGQENDPSAVGFLSPASAAGGESTMAGISTSLVNDLAAERSAMRSEADKIAERLLQTEMVCVYVCIIYIYIYIYIYHNTM
jgi:hypothetical protein